MADTKRTQTRRDGKRPLRELHVRIDEEIAVWLDSIADRDHLSLNKAIEMELRRAYRRATAED